MLNRRNPLRLVPVSRTAPHAPATPPQATSVDQIRHDARSAIADGKEPSEHLGWQEDLEHAIDALAGDVRTFHAAEWAEYKNRLADVMALDPEGLAYRYGSPVCAMDEAAVGLAVSAWADGLRLGAALALERQATA
jgi:hypothetical protein